MRVPLIKLRSSVFILSLFILFVNNLTSQEEQQSKDLIIAYQIDKDLLGFYRHTKPFFKKVAGNYLRKKNISNYKFQEVDLTQPDTNFIIKYNALIVIGHFEHLPISRPILELQKYPSWKHRVLIWQIGYHGKIPKAIREYDTVASASSRKDIKKALKDNLFPFLDYLIKLEKVIPSLGLKNITD